MSKEKLHGNDEFLIWDKEPLYSADATPDEEYVLRILQAHLHNARSGRFISEPTTEFADRMNEAQDKRVILLEKAIDKLILK